MVQPPPVATEFPGNAGPSCMVQPPSATTEIPGNADPQSHGTVTICGHRNSRDRRPSDTWYSHHLWPWKFQGTQTLIHMVQPPPMATEIPGNIDTSCVMQAPPAATEILGNADSSRMVQPPTVAMEILGNAGPSL